MRTKKLPRYLLLFLLTMGASLILGLLSFGGMFALWPILPLAFAAFGLSVAYEGEIYLQNIKGAFNKLFKFNYLKNQLANEFLLHHLEHSPVDTVSPLPTAAGVGDIGTSDVPGAAKAPKKAQFFIDYEEQLELLRQFGHKHLKKTSREQKEKIEKTLRDMEKWFATQLFSDIPLRQRTPYERELIEALDPKKIAEHKALLTKRSRTFQGVKAFSALAGAFMSLGTTYLLVEAFSIIPLLAALPFASLPLLIVPMALIAGAAYGLLTYNAVTDMISNDTINKWFRKIREDLRDKPLRGALMATIAVVLVALALALTICTAGTWWTIAQETRPLFTWMGRMPGFVMGIINPLITGLSAVVFNLQNTSETLEMAHSAVKKIDTPHVSEAEIRERKPSFWAKLSQTENLAQIFNPFRILLKLTFMPLRALLFLGHLISIGVTADRVPGMPQVLSALLGIVSEGFEDYHYFFGHDHHHGELSKKDVLHERLAPGHSHNHDLDLPTRILKLAFMPIYFLATSWDWLTSLGNRAPKSVLSFKDAWNKQLGIHKEKTVDVTPVTSSAAWQVEHTVYRIEKFQSKHAALVGRNVANQKSHVLTNLAADLKGLEEPTSAEISRRIDAIKENEALNTHRFFGSGPTATRKFVDELPSRVNLTAAAAG